MASNGKPEELTSRQIVRLAAAISTHNMESIAEGYLGINYQEIKNLKADNKQSPEAFNREILRKWWNKSSGNNIMVR